MSERTRNNLFALVIAAVVVIVAVANGIYRVSDLGRFIP